MKAGKLSLLTYDIRNEEEDVLLFLDGVVHLAHSAIHLCFPIHKNFLHLSLVLRMCIVKLSRLSPLSSGSTHVLLPGRLKDDGTPNSQRKAASRTQRRMITLRV